ncbi:MAG: hypothetical protein WA970_20440, partial [Gammaproteobacteria bacterium]
FAAPWAGREVPSLLAKDGRMQGRPGMATEFVVPADEQKEKAPWTAAPGSRGEATQGGTLRFRPK